MMRFLIPICFIFCLEAYAQKVLWDKSYGGVHSDYLFDAIPTADYGFILAGSSLSDVTGNKKEEGIYGLDYCLWKIDRKGNLVWQKTYGGNGLDYLKSVNHTTDGGFILGGHSTSTINKFKTETNYGGEDIWILKLDANGEKEWDRSLGGSQREILNSIKQTKDGGYILAASSSSPMDTTLQTTKNTPHFGHLDYWLIKLDTNGEIEWQKTYGGRYREELIEVLETKSGDFILGGVSNSSESGNKSTSNYGNNDIWIIRVDALGNTIWQKTLGGSGDDVLGDMKLIEDQEEEFILVGGSTNSPMSGNKSIDNRNGTDFWLLKLSDQGFIEWQEVYDIGYNDMLTSIEWVKEKQQILIAGHSIANRFALRPNKSNESLDSYILLQLDVQGKELWRKTIGSNGRERLQNIVLTRDNNIVLAGTSDGTISKEKTTVEGREDFWIVMLGKEEEDSMDLASGLEAYPNPTNGYSNIVVLHDFESGKLSVYDIMGKRLQHFSIYDNTVAVNLAGYATGVYLIEVVTDVSKETLKVLKK